MTGRTAPRRGAVDVLFVCTGNTCRSPMAAALLARRLDARFHVHSAGTMPWGGPASDGARQAVAEHGADLTDHVSRALTAELVAGADLVLGMTRDHLGRVTALAPDASAKAFLLGELVRLGRHVGPRRDGQAVADWVASVAAHRPGGRPPGRAADEIADPAGEPPPVYRRTAERLDRLTADLAHLLAGSTGPPPRPRESPVR